MPWTPDLVSDDLTDDGMPDLASDDSSDEDEGPPDASAFDSWPEIDEAMRRMAIADQSLWGKYVFPFSNGCIVSSIINFFVDLDADANANADTSTLTSTWRSGTRFRV